MNGKTRIGISEKMLVVLVYLTLLSGNLTAILLLAGYVLLFEESTKAREHTVQALLIYMIYEGIYFIMQVLPDLRSVINSLVAIFGGHFSVYVIDNICGFVQIAASFAKDIVALILLVCVLGNKDVKIGFLKKLTDKVCELGEKVVSKADHPKA